ncbi:hypothetical protein HHI36_021633 [Cryptolaemus montrouzieri]|uniref:C2H2-type domain-containing protein n=1 Tax=Cryptolaemus montrouzieri TaxID=559131 RepID=A0ABD2MY87_9CUCU
MEMNDSAQEVSCHEIEENISKIFDENGELQLDRNDELSRETDVNLENYKKNENSNKLDSPAEEVERLNSTEQRSHQNEELIGATNVKSGNLNEIQNPVKEGLRPNSTDCKSDSQSHAQDTQETAKFDSRYSSIVLIDYEKQNPIEKTLWSCPYCPYKATKLEYIHIHIADTHATVTCYKCQDCSYAHPQLSLLIEHVNRKHAKIKYQCPSCKCKFTTIWNCEGHILIRHAKKAEKLLQTVSKKRELSGSNRKCPFCDFINDSSSVLKRHVENEHQESIRFKCSYCTYKNIDIDDIADHMAEMHHDETGEVDF